VLISGSTWAHFGSTLAHNGAVMDNFGNVSAQFGHTQIAAIAISELKTNKTG
jgi:hypothetical protein